MVNNERLNRLFVGKFRTKLMLFVLLPVVVALALALERNFSQRRTEKERVVYEIESISRLINLNTQGYVKNARQILATLSGIEFLVNSTDERVCTVHFQNLLKLLPDYYNFGLIESNGTVFSSAVIPAGPTPSLEDRSYFRRAVRTQKFAIGDFQEGRLTNEAGINFAYPIFDKSGNVKRVLFASLNIARIAEAAREVAAPESGVIMVLDGNGTILARMPNGEEWTGRSVPDMEVTHAVLKVQQGTAEAKGLDGVRRIYAVSAIRDDSSPRIFVAVGVPTEVLFGNANATLRRNVVFLAVFLLLALLVSSFFAERHLVRPLNNLASTADKLASGDLAARATVMGNTEELIHLSAAFNGMAEKLQARDTEVKKAHEEIRTINAELEQKVSERTAQLSAANQELEAFSYSVSHDLRAPLRHMDGFAELLKRHQHDRLDEKGRRHLDVISQAARRMGLLIDDLLVFSRMGRQDLLKSPLDMGAVVRETIERLEPDYVSRKVKWKLGDLPKVEADPAMLRQVWVNLISNAIKYTRPRETTEIEIGSTENAAERVFFIRDNGVGFDMKYADKLFGVFQRLHADNEFEGTGIGLANVRRIILRHGGQTWAESIPGTGSTFYFSLPRA